MSKTAFIAAALLAASSVYAQTQCGPTNGLCPKSAPCCSEYGFCDKGHFCLGGCNPFFSNEPESCRAMPLCEPATYLFNDLSVMVNHTEYEGNSTIHQWTIDEGSPAKADNNVALVLTETNKGTKISSTKYLHYGRITARLRTSKWAGVVTAFITMSNVKDEIDWEWPGTNVDQGQSNFFFQGNVDYATGSNGGYHDGIGDAHADFHDYTIDWQPETLSWYIDGQQVRSITKESTLKNGKYEYPTTPARIQLSIWAAGIPEMPAGTVEWADGMIDWTNPDYVAWGNQYVVIVESVTVQCDDVLPIGPETVSYVYGANDTFGIPQVFASNETTSLNSGLRGIDASYTLSLGLAIAAVVAGVWSL